VRTSLRLAVRGAAAAVLAAALLIPAVIRPAPAAASDGPTDTSFTVDAGTLTLATPDSADLGTVTIGTAAVSGQLGAITVTDDRGLASGAWTASVSSTSFTTGAGTPAETIPAANASYAAGGATATSGTGTFAPGAGGALNVAEPAFVATDTTGTTSATWNPTITVTLPAAVVSGTYTGTITHSVA